MAKRETKPIEQLLSNAKNSRKIVRELIEKQGASLQHIYDQLGEHEEQFTARLKELQEHNRREEAKAKADADAKTKADAGQPAENISEKK